MRDSSFFTVIFSGYGDKSPDNRTGCKGDAAIPSIAAIGYNQSMNMHESGEMYLETILRLSERNNIVRSVDVAQMLGYSKPSISRAMKNLRENGYIGINPSTGAITLLEPGRRIASAIYERHQVLTQSLMSLGVPAETAQEDACRIEHVISDESFQALKNHIKEHIRQ